MEVVDPRQAPDEIDLVRVFIRIVDFFGNNWKLFLLASACAVGSTFGYMAVKPEVYQSRFTGQCMSLPDGRTIELLNDLDKLRENEDWIQLGEKLRMKPDQAKKIKKIEPLSTVTIDKEAKGIDDYLLPTTEVAYNFSVVVKVKDNGILPDLQKGIIHYISNNQYSRIHVERFIENRRSLLQSIDNELRKLDSLNLLFANKIVNSPSSHSLASPGDFKAVVISLKEKRLSVEDELRFAEPVRVFQGFTAFKSPVEPVFSMVLVLFLAAFNGAAIFFLLVRFLRNLYVHHRLASYAP